MADAGAGRHDAEIVEGRLAPAQEPVALAVALIFELDVPGEGTLIAELVDHDRMVDDQVDRDQRIDLLGIAAERPHGVAHRGEVDHRRHAGEILHQHARRPEGDLAIALLRRQPGGHGADVVGGDRALVLAAQQVLEQHLQRVGQPRDVGETVLLGLGQAEIFIRLAADGEGAARFESIEGGCGQDQLLKQSHSRGKARAGSVSGGKRPALTWPGEATMKVARLIVDIGA